MVPKLYPVVWISTRYMHYKCDDGEDDEKVDYPCGYVKGYKSKQPE